MTRFRLVDRDHNVYECTACGYLHRFEADGAQENGWTVCPACGEPINTRFAELGDGDEEDA